MPPPSHWRRMHLPFANLQVKYQNPHASKPLMLPVTVICNTSDEDLHANIRTNSRRKAVWVKQEPAHSLVAVLCGSGPSLTESIEEIRKWQKEGAVIFSMNGSAAYLHKHGILADYQVLIDPRPVTASLVGPARQHLFASQVHPSCFEKVPDAIVWHLQIEGIEELFPDVYPEHALMGGAASVGNTATCLAYAMGYRTLNLYGYDSSHRNGEGHAFHQAINDGDPCAKVVFNGKEYLTSLTMKLQAERFQSTGRELEQAGCTIVVHGDGLLPTLWNTPSELLTEQEKYERMWRVPGYRTYSPGEESVETFLGLVATPGTVLDIGCGTGRASVKLKEAGFQPILLDFTENSRDYPAMVLPFFQHDLDRPFPVKAEYGYCVDVLEHIPTEKVRSVLQNILSACHGPIFLQISTEPDQFGAVINQDLHLTVKPGEWWAEQIQSVGGVITWVNTREHDVQFLVHS